MDVSQLFTILFFHIGKFIAFYVCLWESDTLVIGDAKYCIHALTLK
jgi:hypothetical protein